VERGDTFMSTFDVAQVCLNGHPANDSMRRLPQFNKNFCSKCGERTIRTCSSCNNPIPGQYHVEGVVSVGFRYHPPAYCQSCGSAFPWTTRGIQAAIEFAKLELDEADKEVFEQNVGELVKDSPQTKVAAARIRKVFAKSGSAFGDSIREILVDIASESAKKMLWG